MPEKRKSRQVTLTAAVYDKLDIYRRKVQAEVGFKVSLAQAIVRLLNQNEEIDGGKPNGR